MISTETHNFFSHFLTKFLNLKPCISTSTWDREPKFSGKFPYIFTQLSWKYGFFISRTSGDISLLTDKKWKKQWLVQRETFYEKPYISASTIDRESKFSENFLYIIKKLSWKFGLSVYSRSWDMRVSLEVIPEKKR